MISKKSLCPLVALIFFFLIKISQAEVKKILPPFQLISNPIAGVIPQKKFIQQIHFLSHESVQFNSYYGITDRIDVALSYGSRYLIGYEEIKLNKNVELLFKALLIQEKNYFPAVALGYSSISSEIFYKNYNRNRYLPVNFFLGFSKNYDLFGDWGFYSTLSYTPDNKYGENHNFIIGMDKEIFYDLYCALEYDFSLNDQYDSEKKFTGKGKKRGYLNLAIVYYINSYFKIETVLYDLLLNSKISGNRIRTLRFSYLFNL